MNCYRCNAWPCVCSDGITVIWGDCREVLSGLGDSSVDLFFSDPPYGHNNNNGDLISKREQALGRDTTFQKPRPIANDGVEANELVKWWFGECKRLLKPGCCCCCCCCGGGGPDPQFARWSLWLNDVLDFKQMVVWDKGPMGMGWHYRRSYETVLVAQKPGAACRWFAESQKIENIIRPGQWGIRKIIPSERQHPTEKPVELSRHFIGLHSQEGDLVVDPFAGHGTTLRAAKDLGRRAIGIELHEPYVAITCERLRQEVLF